MSQVRVLDAAERRIAGRHASGALDLAARLPRLAMEARQVSMTVSHGVHGRRRAGTGETFWQFRPFVAGEPASRIDWRRSARDDRHYVREREWEAAHTVWLWMDRSPSMAFQSSLAKAPKLDRAVMLGLAMADLLVRGGERIGLMGLTPPYAQRGVVDRFCEALSTGADAARDLPPPTALAPTTEAVVIGDFLDRPERVAETIARISSRGARGHLMMIADPAEDTFPFDGHVKLNDLEIGADMRIGDAGAFRQVYLARIAQHRDVIASACRARGWSFAVHVTDRSAAQALLALAARVASPSNAIALGASANGGRA